MVLEANGRHFSSQLGLQEEDDDVGKGGSKFQIPTPIVSGDLGHVDDTYTSVGHIEILGHELNNGLELCSFLESVGRLKETKVSPVRSKEHLRPLLIDYSHAFALSSFKRNGSLVP